MHGLLKATFLSLQMELVAGKMLESMLDFSQNNSFTTLNKNMMQTKQLI
jgi:hypothetical protein